MIETIAEMWEMVLMGVLYGAGISMISFLLPWGLRQAWNLIRSATR